MPVHSFTRSRRRTNTISSALALALAVTTTLGAARAAHADVGEANGPPGQMRHLGLAIGAAVAGAAIGVELSLPRFWFELHADASPPPFYGDAPPAPPPPPCCYPPPPAPFPPPPSAPPPMLEQPVVETPAREARPQLGLAVNGIVQAPQSDTGTSGFSVSLQARTSARSLFALELQSLDVQRGSRERTDRAGLLVGRLFAWDAALAPYLDLAGGLGQAAVDSQDGSISSSQLIGRVGVGLELRLGPHLVLEGQVAEVYRLRLEHPPGAPPADPTGIPDREQSSELRGGLAYRW